MSGKIAKKKLVEAFKSKPCAHCGKQYHYCQMDIHHVDESTKHELLKEYVGRYRRRKLEELSRELLEAELEKCVALCKNCHALHHFTCK